MLSVLPLISTAAVVPPWGYMMFLAWRLLHREIWHPWAGVALGLFDDMWSGQPIGSAMVLWSLSQLIISVADQRMMWRDHWQDFALAALCICVTILGALCIANITGGQTLWVYILPQILVTILFQPLVMRVCARLDLWRFS
jgi:rod shape-determining protein MreD